MTERQNRSDAYQWKILEVTFDMQTGSAELWKLEDGLHLQSNQQYLDLNDKALNRVIELIKTNCTEHQLQIINLLLEGKTQVEIAAKLNCNQSSIVKSIKGNHTYEKGKAVKKYGGLSKKIKFVMLHDKVLKDILIELRECQ